MRLDDGDGGIVSVAFYFIAVFILPLVSLLYCTHSKSIAGKPPLSSTKSNASKSMPGPPPDGTDLRAAWALNFLETATPKSIFTEFIVQLKDYNATGRTAAGFEANAEKNRYRDIPCYDQDRVILMKWPYDYINANYMNAPDGVKYIATQGPLAETRCDFWHMVVQEEAMIVLQLCKFVEGDNEKCAEYWPVAAGATATELEKFTIRKISGPEEIAPGTVKHTLRIESKTVNRTITHLFCEAWPDQLAPTNPATIVKVWNYIKENRGTGPVVVHCSAGVGRTATFVGISYGVVMLQKPRVGVIDVVKEMRLVRQKAVQTHIQYGFLHACLLEVFIQMKLIERTPAAVTFFEAFRKSVDRKLERKDKSTNE